MKNILRRFSNSL